jgi:hypothetical protein
MPELAWHFLRDDWRLQYPPCSVVVAGGTYTAQGPLELCKNGMHASLQALDALRYAPGTVVCRVLLGGEIVYGHDSFDKDKVCARTRTVLWLAEAGAVLHEFACRVGEQALARSADAGYPPDFRSTDAIKIKRAWLRGEVSDADVDAAWKRAWDAVWHTTWDVADSATWTMAQAAAARAAKDAVRIAAWATARSTPWAGIWGASSTELEQMLLALAPAEGTPA